MPHPKRLLFVVFLALALLAAAPPAPAVEQARPRNLILLIADGCGAAHWNLLRWWKGSPLAVDPHCVGMVRTHIADSVVADSAPAGTAMATGVLTGGKHIGLGPAAQTVPADRPVPPRQKQAPLATLLEGARLRGKAVGLVATSRITHATPASFAAHTASRYDENMIMLQMVHQGLDVALGGGRRHELPRDAGGKRGDGLDLAAVLAAKGYEQPRTAAELEQIHHGKVFGLFAASHLSPEVDRAEVGPRQPTLPQMTAKAIELLAQDPDGFFLMVEGSQIDWASHANDPGYLMGEMSRFDEACRIALDFARKDGRTLVVVVSDHDTGGLSIGNGRSDGTYMHTRVEQVLGPIRAMKRSAGFIWDELNERVNAARLGELVRRYWGVELTPGQTAEILEVAEQARLYPKVLEPFYGLGRVVCRDCTLLGWTTHGHVGADVPLFAFGPMAPGGMISASELGRACAAALGLDLDALSGRLFVDLAAELGPENVVVITSEGEPTRIVCRRGGRELELIAGTNVMVIDGHPSEMEGVTVYVRPTGKAFAPRQVPRALGLTAAAD